MRFLNTTTLKFESIPDFELELPGTRYAIVSHRWRHEEISFQDIELGRDISLKHGYKKLTGACKLAQQEGINLLWLDTCCIDQSNNNELTTSINSMYYWYEKATVCYAYLEDVQNVSVNKAIGHSVWFTRGWTLQELIAPRAVRFYDTNWRFLGSKNDLRDILTETTGIPVDVLQNLVSPESCSIAQRMSWAANRSTQRIEDAAYSLLGLFDVNMPLIYGEREKAFFRLQQEIIKSSADESIFAWEAASGAQTSPAWGSPFAPTPACFTDCGAVVQFRDTVGFTIGQFGLSANFDAHACDLGVFQIRLRAGVTDKGKQTPYIMYLAKLGDSESFTRVLHPRIVKSLTDDKMPHEIYHIRSSKFNIRLREKDVSRGVPYHFTRYFRGWSFSSVKFREDASTPDRCELFPLLQTYDRARIAKENPITLTAFNGQNDMCVYLKAIFNFTEHEHHSHNSLLWDVLLLGCAVDTLETTCALLKRKGADLFSNSAFVRRYKNTLALHDELDTETWSLMEGHLSKHYIQVESEWRLPGSAANTIMYGQMHGIVPRKGWDLCVEITLHDDTNGIYNESLEAAHSFKNVAFEASITQRIGAKEDTVDNRSARKASSWLPDRWQR